MKKNKPIQSPTLQQMKHELRRVKYRTRYRSVLWSTVFTLVIVAAFAILAATLWMPVLEIYGASMTPTLEKGEIVVSVKSNSFTYGDVVAFYYGNKLLVKRCIALPGDVIEITEDGDVYVNDEALEEPYVSEKALGECDIEFPYTVPQETYFLMGDHRATSLDSRSSIIGSIAEDEMVGRIVFRVWPLSKIGTIGE